MTGVRQLPGRNWCAADRARRRRARRPRSASGPAGGRATQLCSFDRLRCSGLVGVIPPDRWEPGAVFRHLLWMAEPVPASCARFVDIELRHHIVVPQKHPVERVRGRHKGFTVFCENDLVDQLVDGRVLDTRRNWRSWHCQPLQSPSIRVVRCPATATDRWPEPLCRNPGCGSG